MATLVDSSGKSNGIPEPFSDSERRLLTYLHAKHYPTLVEIANKLVRDSATSHDVVMDLLFHVTKKHRDFGARSLHLPYLVRSTVNRSINYIHKQECKRKHMRLIFEAEYADKFVAPASALERYELKARIQQAIKKLPAKTRIIFCLHRYHKMTYREISSYKKISVKSVENHISTALRCLRQSVSADAEYRVP